MIMKKQFLLILIMLLPMITSADDSGICGENLIWTYVESTHTLTISGTGAMVDYMGLSPWSRSYGSKINKAIIEDGVTTIGEGAFNKCNGLIKVTIGNNVTSIGDYAFAYCHHLTYITIPNSVTSIGDYAFGACWGLTSFTIPNSVTSIGGNAFIGCRDLTNLYCLAKNIPNTKTDTFDNSTIEKATLHVPAASLNKYSSSTPWKFFKEIVALTDQELNVEGITKDNMTEVSRYTIDGQHANQNTKGLNIVRMSNGKTQKVFVK